MLMLIMSAAALTTLDQFARIGQELGAAARSAGPRPHGRAQHRPRRSATSRPRPSAPPSSSTRTTTTSSSRRSPTALPTGANTMHLAARPLLPRGQPELGDGAPADADVDARRRRRRSRRPRRARRRRGAARRWSRRTSRTGPALRSGRSSPTGGRRAGEVQSIVRQALPRRRSHAGAAGDARRDRRLPPQPEPRARSRRFTATPAGIGHVLLNASDSVDPEDQPLEVRWFDGTKAIGRGTIYDYNAKTRGAHQITVEVTRRRRARQHARPGQRGGPMTTLRARLESERGSALVTAVLVMAIMMSIAVPLMSMVDTQQRMTSAERLQEGSFNLTDAVLNAQVFVLSNSWPASVADAYPTCTQKSVSLKCPSPSAITSVYTGADYTAQRVDRARARRRRIRRRLLRRGDRQRPAGVGRQRERPGVGARGRARNRARRSRSSPR